MKKYGIALVFCALLSACGGGYYHQAQSQIQQSLALEMSGWEKAQQLYYEHCPNPKKYKYGNMPVNKSVEGADCYEKYVIENVIPISIDPIIVRSLLAEYKQVAIDLENGKINRDQATLEIQKSWNKYTSLLSEKLNRIEHQAYQADVIAAQQMQQSLQNLNQQLNPPRPPVTNTNCHVFGSMLNCTSSTR